MQKLFYFILISFTLSFGYDVKNFGLTTIDDKVNGAKINVEINRFQQDVKHVCFEEMWDIHKTISFNLKVNGSEVFLPAALYCFLVEINQFNFRYEKGLFILDGSSGDASTSLSFEIFFNEKDIVRAYVFTYPKQDTTMQFFFKPVYGDYDY